MNRPDNPSSTIHPFLSAELLTVSRGGKTVLKDLSFSIGRGEHWLLTGAAGIGKSTLGKGLCGELFLRGDLQIHYDTNGAASPVAFFVDQWYHFTDHTGLSSNFYYQQRYNSQDSDSAITVEEELNKVAAGRNASVDRNVAAGGSVAVDQNAAASAATASAASEASSRVQELLAALALEHRAGASLVQLSSGEHKKLQLAKAFLSEPAFLVLDNPYVGLDAATCLSLDKLFESLALKGTQLIIIGDDHTLPPVITHVATLFTDRIDIVPRGAYSLCHDGVSSLPVAAPAMPAYLGDMAGEDHLFSDAVRMENVHVQYEDKVILDQIDWTVHKGQRWWVKGHNGAGKSTLLSLIVGDNPQAYANKIYLFDKRRGSGESIWDIKRKIGYISPELHWYFDQQTTCEDAIATGFFDTTGLYRSISAGQSVMVEQWMEVFELTPFRGQRIQDLSIGRQRMTLLARALVKNPPVLILDEPCQGLDDRQAAHFLGIVDRIMEHSSRTLLYVSHRTDQLPSCISHVLALEGGKQIKDHSFNHTPLTVQL